MSLIPRKEKATGQARTRSSELICTHFVHLCTPVLVFTAKNSETANLKTDTTPPEPCKKKSNSGTCWLVCQSTLEQALTHHQGICNVSAKVGSPHLTHENPCADGAKGGRGWAWFTDGGFSSERPSWSGKLLHFPMAPHLLCLSYRRTFVYDHQ